MSLADSIRQTASIARWASDAPDTRFGYFLASLSRSRPNCSRASSPWMISDSS